MSVISKEVSIGASAFVENIFAGSAFEFAKTRQLVSIGATAAATGLLMFLSSGGDIIVEETPPMVLTTFPIIPDHFFFNDAMEVMDRLRLQVRNTTAGAIVFRAIAQITPV